MAAEWVRKRFVREVVPALLRCGCTEAQALHAAAVGAALSDFGRVTPGFNYWAADCGDAGPMLLVRGRRCDDIRCGGIEPEIERLGWWSSVHAAAQDALQRKVLDCAVPAAEWQEVRRLWGAA